MRTRSCYRTSARFHRTESRLDRLIGGSTLAVRPRNPRRGPIVLRHVRHGHQLAALLDLLSEEPRATIDLDAIRATMTWEPASGPRVYAKALMRLLAVLMAIFVAIGLHGKTSPPAVHPRDDAIYFNGEKRPKAEIVRFMKTEVLPWARTALVPIKGDADRITCETCHGSNPEVRDWRMPAVAALPQPDVRDEGWERYGGEMDAQMRNAIYGYLAESDKQAKAAYMRTVIVPGMARLLHRPAYDFTQPYEYNRSRVAFGCYHCHRVK